MSPKDTAKAVQTVLDTFGPVMAALPEVIDALGKQDKAERRLKQLEADAGRLVDQYNTQVTLWEAAETDHKAKLAALTSEHVEQLDKAKAMLREVQRKQREANKAIEDKEKALLVAQSVIEDELAKVQAECAKQIQDTKARTAEQIAIIEAQVEAVNKRHAAATKKLEDLKSKL